MLHLPLFLYMLQHFAFSFLFINYIILHYFCNILDQCLQNKLYRIMQFVEKNKNNRRNNKLCLTIGTNLLRHFSLSNQTCLCCCLQTNTIRECCHIWCNHWWLLGSRTQLKTLLHNLGQSVWTGMAFVLYFTLMWVISVCLTQRYNCIYHHHHL